MLKTSASTVTGAPSRLECIPPPFGLLRRSAGKLAIRRAQDFAAVLKTAIPLASPHRRLRMAAAGGVKGGGAMRKRGGAGVAAAVVSVVALVAATAAWAGPSSRQVQILDNCDGPSFNAVIGPGTCNRSGGLTFQKFFAALSKGGASSWRFSPGQLKVEAGGTITARNRGGEFHTFTPVAAFGAGCIAALNGPLGLTPVPECDIPGILETTGVVPGASLTTDSLGAGTQPFQCLIHPWMKTTVSAG
jgi:plastocyanin